MSQTRSEKAEIIAELKGSFQEATATVLADYKGLSVADMDELRNALGENGRFRVVKNTLAKIAAEGTSTESAGEHFTGPVGIATTAGDPVDLIKTLLAYAKKNEKFELKTGVFEGKLFNVEELKAISKLPARPALLSQMAGVFQAPSQKLAVGLSQTIARMGYALKALQDKKQASGAQ